MTRTPDDFIASYIEAMAGQPTDLARLVVEPCGLDALGTVTALNHPALALPEYRGLGVSLMADLMAPEGSIYYDAIFGAYHGQAAIRGWLVPAMADIDFIDFVPTAEPALFDDGLGGTSLDEWQMFANMGDDKIPLSRGVSVRRYRDGWITWACDVYDTGPFRQPPPPDAGIEAAPLPAWPRVVWEADPSVPETVAAEVDFGADAERFHPTDSVYHDPLFGEIRGQAAIRAWLTDIMGKVGNVVFEPLGPELNDGATSVQEWQQMAVLPDGTRVFVTRGTSVRRFVDGWIVYAADYFDTASLMDPDIQAASTAAGSTVTLADIVRYRSN